MSEDVQYVTVKDAAEQLGVSVVTVRRYIGTRDGRSPIMTFARTAGGRPRIPQTEIDRLKELPR